MPLAIKTPFICIDLPTLKLTVTPGSIVKVTPLLTSILLVIIYLPTDSLHVSFDEMIPDFMTYVSEVNPFV